MAREIVMEIAIREHTVRGMLCEFGDENRSSRNSLDIYSSFFIFLSSNGIILDIKFEEKLLSYYYHSDWRVFFVGIFIYSFSL